MIYQLEAASSAREEGERNKERAKEARPPRREEGWAFVEGEQQVLKGLHPRVSVNGSGSAGEGRNTQVRVRVRNCKDRGGRSGGCSGCGYHCS